MNRIKDFREDCDITQKELSKRMGVTISTISHWENDHAEITSGNLLKLSDILSVSTDELLGKKTPTPKIIYKEIDNLYQYIISKLESLSNSELLRIQGAVESLLYNRNNPTAGSTLSIREERVTSKKGS